MATALSMELVIDTANQRVLFAEASKGAVDYLHSLLSSLAFDNATAGGCVGNLYDSVELLDAAARAAGAGDRLPPPPALPSPSTVVPPAKRFFQCGDKHGARCARYVAEARGARCPSCGRKMAAEVAQGSPGAGCSGENAAAGEGGGGGAGADDGSVMCLLKDDLTVMPVPASKLELARTMALCVLSDVVSVAALERRTVLLGYTEGLAILEASLQSSTVLTDVFVGNK